MNTRKLIPLFASVILAALLSTSAFAQGRASLRGQVSDEFGASIVGATVTLTDASGAVKTATSNADGGYSFTGLAPGKYILKATATGFATAESEPIDLTAARRDPVNLTLKIAAIETQVKVNADTPLSTESGNNANQTLITGKDLDALPDDPAELAAALQALAGPSIGPNGGQIFIDGFSSGNMPPKESIREIRINQNPFAAENDQPSASINIFTKPGSDKFRVGLNLNFNDESLNSRNPFAISSSKRTPYQVRQYGGNFSGPLKKGKASFFLELNRSETDDNDVVRGTILDSSLNFVQLGQGVLIPRRFTNFGPRVDYAINSSNTLVARYNYNHSVTRNNGVGGFSLPERGYNNSFTSQVVQITETAVLNPTTINETRFQFSHNQFESLGNSTRPVLNVSGAFIGGGSQVGHAINTSNRWELANFTQIQHGNHAIKFGGRVRGVSVDDIQPFNFGGQWIFTGGTTGLTSIQRYQKTLQLMRLGQTPAQIRAQGGGASQFAINTGNPEATVSQFDIQPYVQDDWRIRPNLTFSFGVRYEVQSNADSNLGFAPRMAVAWSPGAATSTKPPKTVIRFGTGIFYNRFNEQQTLQIHRFDGLTEQSFAVTEPTRATPPTVAEQSIANVAPIYNFLNSFGCADGSATPNCVTNVPSVAGLPASQQTVYRIVPNLRVPTVYVLGGQVERQLPHNFTVTVGSYALRILHVIRLRDVNAPVPGSITAANPNGIRPIAAQGEIYQYESSAKFHQKQLFISVNSRLNPQMTVSASYVLAKSSNDADGQGSNALPRDSYDLTGEFGRGGGDVRHRFSVFGTYNSKLWKLVFNPFVVANTGPPFNITTGIDSNLDRAYTDRPSFAAAGANCTSTFIRCTQFGNFNLIPNPGEQIIPRNFGNSPGSLSVNLRISRTFGFGDVHKAAPSGQSGAQNTGNKRPAGGGGPSRGPSIPGGGGGGEVKMGGGPGMGMIQMGGGGAASEKKYTLNVGIFFQNLLNTVNLSQPVGNLSSPLFGQSQGLSGGFGGFGGPGGSSNAGNRRISISMRLNF